MGSLLSLSVIIASSGRPTLARTLDSVAGQMVAGDELLLSVNDNSPWGHAARNKLMRCAQGTALLFIDDDDAYLPGALNVVRTALAEHPTRVHIFKMRYGANSAAPGAEVWTEREVVEGQVSTQTVCVPTAIAVCCRWGDRYAGDFDFISAAAAHPRAGGPPVWHENVIALYRP